LGFRNDNDGISSVLLLVEKSVEMGYSFRKMRGGLTCLLIMYYFMLLNAKYASTQ